MNDLRKFIKYQQHRNFQSDQFLNQVPQPLDEFVEFTPSLQNYKPIMYINTYWNLNRDYTPINDTVKFVNLTVTFQTLSMFKWQMYSAQVRKYLWQTLCIYQSLMTPCLPPLYQMLGAWKQPPCLPWKVGLQCWKILRSEQVKSLNSLHWVGEDYEASDLSFTAVNFPQNELFNYGKSTKAE